MSKILCLSECKKRFIIDLKVDYNVSSITISYSKLFENKKKVWYRLGITE